MELSMRKLLMLLIFAALGWFGWTSWESVQSARTVMHSGGLPVRDELATDTETSRAGEQMPWFSRPDAGLRAACARMPDQPQLPCLILQRHAYDDAILIYAARGQTNAGPVILGDCWQKAADEKELRGLALRNCLRQDLP
jgi:hypothetical protein